MTGTVVASEPGSGRDRRELFLVEGVSHSDSGLAFGYVALGMCGWHGVLRTFGPSFSSRVFSCLFLVGFLSCTLWGCAVGTSDRG